MELPPNTPVLVGAAAVEQKLDDHRAAREAVTLMADAVTRAAAEAGCPQLPALAGRIAVPQGLWQYRDPGRLVADTVGAADAVTVLADIGILQQSLIGDGCRRIAAGEIDVAVVTGGEHRYRWLQAQKAGEEATETAQPEDAAPDEWLKPELDPWSEPELLAGLGMPVGYYAIMESALRAARGLDLEDHRDRLAALYRRFSEIAADNPHAWRREPVAAAAIRDASARNPMLAFPYTKLHNSAWNVDQAAALIFTSAARARELGIDESRWIYPLVSSECNQMLHVSTRPTLHDSPGAGASARAAYAAAGIAPAEVTHWELYSCFPVAVSIYADEGRVPEGVDLTVTGGMAFAGGPLNNYVLQATARMAERLRAEGGVGMLSSVSGMLTKQAWALWSDRPRAPFSHLDVTAEVCAANPGREVAGDYRGEGRIAGYTVLYQGGEPERAVALVDLPDGRRSVCYNRDPQLMAACMEQEFVGRTVTVDGSEFS